MNKVVCHLLILYLLSRLQSLLCFLLIENQWSIKKKEEEEESMAKVKVTLSEIISSYKLIYL